VHLLRWPVAVLFVAAALVRAQPPQPAKGQLQVTGPILSQFEDGAALSGSERLVLPGESIFFRFTVANFKTTETGKVKVTGHAQAMDSRGTPIAPMDEVAIGTSLNDEDKAWKPRLRFQFQMPSIAPPGTYRIKFDATDEQSHQTASGETTFTVTGQDVAPAAALAVRNLGFYRTQDDEAALKNAAYRPGDMVWVRFDVTGYKYGEQNAIDVSYDVAVLEGDGKQLFLQENAAVERSQAYYPQPWVPGTFSLTLQPNMTPGLYTVAVTARDGIGNQTIAEKAQFRVE